MDEDKYKRVYAKDVSDEEYVEIQPEYVYMTIPAEYICIYHKILTLFADFGVEMLDDCCSGCKNHNKKLLECFNMFNAAVAARKLGNKKLATNLIKYIEGQLDIIYDKNTPCPGAVYPVDKDGHIKAIVSCEEYPRFFVSLEDGKLYAEYLEKNSDAVYAIDNDNLIRETNDTRD